MGTGRVRLAFVGLSALAAAACASVLGIQDRSLDPEAEGGTSDGGGVDGGGEAGSAGPPVQMATGLNHPFLIAADESNVYWTEFGDDLQTDNGSVKSCPVSGCASGPLVYAVLQSNPRGIAVDAQSVYWGASGAIFSCPIGASNCKPTQVVAAGAPFQLSLDALYVYWADNFDDTVHRARKSGGGDTQLWDAGSSTIGLTNGQGCVVDALNVYVTDYDYNLFRLPIAGGNLVQMYSQNQGWLGAAPIALDSNSAYLGVPGQILQMDKHATSGAKPIVNEVAGVDDLTVDQASGDVYWSDWGSGSGTDGTVGRVPPDGGAATVLHQSLVTPEAVAVNSIYVFWLSNGTIAPGGMGNTTSGTGMVYRSGK